jgi:hypothetical protein
VWTDDQVSEQCNTLPLQKAGEQIAKTGWRYPVTAVRELRDKVGLQNNQNTTASFKEDNETDKTHARFISQKVRTARANRM